MQRATLRQALVGVLISFTLGCGTQPTYPFVGRWAKFIQNDELILEINENGTVVIDEVAFEKRKETETGTWKLKNSDKDTHTILFVANGRPERVIEWVITMTGPDTLQIVSIDGAPGMPPFRRAK